MQSVFMADMLWSAIWNVFLWDMERTGLAVAVAVPVISIILV